MHTTELRDWPAYKFPRELKERRYTRPTIDEGWICIRCCRKIDPGDSDHEMALKQSTVCQRIQLC